MRYRIEIYDDIKSNDLTITTNTFTDVQGLRKYMQKNINKFSSTVRAYVFDNKQNKKVVAAFFPMEKVWEMQGQQQPL